jgi:hypothetical protein
MERCQARRTEPDALLHNKRTIGSEPPRPHYFLLADHSGRMDPRFQSSGNPYGAAMAAPDIIATAHRVHSYKNHASRSRF